ncbi:MAG TPA: hypothetical protein VFA70_06055 [Dehalococcoidia bacterium]|nr:hypothetical protein [Dehalococcoidia bacterium]
MGTPAASLTVTLSKTEAELLVELLGNNLRDLREEVYKTEDYDWRQALKQREATLRALLERLQAPVA